MKCVACYANDEYKEDCSHCSGTGEEPDITGRALMCDWYMARKSLKKFVAVEGGEVVGLETGDVVGISYITSRVHIFKPDGTEIQSCRFRHGVLEMVSRRHLGPTMFLISEDDVPKEVAPA